MASEWKIKTKYKKDIELPICDPVGFRQHSGECWADSIQQFVLFVDGIKERSQQFFLDNDEDSIRALLVDLAKNETEAMKELFVEVLIEMQKRFIYKLSILGKHGRPCNLANKTCPQVRRKNYAALENTSPSAAGAGPSTESAAGTGLLPSGPKLPATPSDTCSVRIEQLFRNVTGHGNAGKGGNVRITAKVFSLFFNLFGLDWVPYTVIKRRIGKIFGLKHLIYNTTQDIIPLERIYGVECGGNYFTKNSIRYIHDIHNIWKNQNEISRYKPEIIAHKGHSVLFYTCNGVRYYYDDNYGIFKVPNDTNLTLVNMVIYKRNIIDNNLEVVFLHTEIDPSFSDDEESIFLEINNVSNIFNNIENYKIVDALIFYRKIYIMDSAAAAEAAAVAAEAVAAEAEAAARAEAQAAAQAAARAQAEAEAAARAAAPPLVGPGGCGTLSCLRKLFSRRQRQNAGRRLKRRKTRRL